MPKYFLDTEFIEDGKTIDLISIGIVCEDGREYYAIASDCDFSKASDWVLKNVLEPIGLNRNGWIEKDPNMMSPRVREGYLRSLPKTEIGRGILNFCNPVAYGEPEFWAYYADYDWVVFCQLFGTMMDLPGGFPMYCNDIKQECDLLGNPQLPKQNSGEHNAIEDARWNKLAWDYLNHLEAGDLENQKDWFNSFQRVSDYMFDSGLITEEDTIPPPGTQANAKAKPEDILISAIKRLKNEKRLG